MTSELTAFLSLQSQLQASPKRPLRYVSAQVAPGVFLYTDEDGNAVYVSESLSVDQLVCNVAVMCDCSMAEALEHINEEFSVQYLALDDQVLRALFTHYLTLTLNPVFGCEK